MIFAKRAPAPPAAPSIPEGGNKPKNIVQIFGAGETGKTLLAKAIVRERMRRGGNTVVVDPNACFAGYGRVVSVEQAKRILQVANGRRFNLVVRPGRFGEDLSEIFQACFDAGNMLVCVDEAALFSDDRNLQSLVIQGRNRYVDLVMTCQKATSLNHVIRFNYSVGIAFCQTSKLAAERFVAEYAGDRAELVPVLLKLPKFHYIRVPFGGAPQRGRVPDPAIHGTP